MRRRTLKFLLGEIGIWLLLGVEIGVFYSHAPYPVLVPVCLVAALIELFIITLLFLHLREEARGFTVVLYPLLLLAILIVATLTLLLKVFFG